MSRSLAQLLPMPEPKQHRIQGDIPASLFAKADQIRRQRKLKCNQIVNALLEKFVEDLGPKQKPEGSFELKRVTLDPNQNRSHWK